MYRGFDIQGLNENSFSSYEHIGNELYADYERQFSEKIESYEDRNGSIDASMISDDWFPTIEADIFLSHSHRDHNLIVNIAGWLQDKFGLRAFIDAAMWGYADNLLKKIDDAYSRSSWSPDTMYDYQKRNNSTSHVHMMLTVGLAEMINRCEAIFFINTPSSIKAGNYLGEDTTGSPWIFTEIAMMRLIKKSPPQFVTESAKTFAMDSADVKPLVIRYPADLSDLTELSYRDLMAWEKASTTSPKPHLNTLYKRHPEGMHGQ